MKVSSPIFDSLSGKIGGAVAAKAKGGIQYLRSKVTPKNPQSYLQSTVRSILTAVAGAWKATLNNSQRAAWALLASGSEQGLSVYMRVNSELVLGGVARQDTAPTSPSLAWSAIPLPSEFSCKTTPVLAGGSCAKVGLSLAGTHYLPDTTSYINFYVQDRVQPDSRGALVGHMAYGGTFHVNGTAVPTIDVPTFTHPLLSGTAAGKVVQVEAVGFSSTGSVTGRIGTKVTTT